MPHSIQSTTAGGFHLPAKTIFPSLAPGLMRSAIEKLMLLERLYAVYDSARNAKGDASIFDRLLDSMNVRAVVSEEDVARVPKRGPVVVVANHPFGLIEGPVLGSILWKVRTDVKVMANSLMAAMPEVAGHCILVNPFGGPEAMRSNRRGLKEAIGWLRGGGMLVMFPAGAVARVDVKRRQITDPEWNPAVGRIVRMTGAPVLPMYFAGKNSALFHIAGMVHPAVRTAMLPHEFLNKKHASVEVRMGHAISPKRMEGFASEEELVDYLRRRIYALGLRREERPRHFHGIARAWIRKSGAEPVIDAVPPGRMEVELAALDPSHFVAEQGSLAAVLARADEVPNVLREIGRLRETTFRGSGEGTGRSFDLDRFDADYLHLFLWNRERREVAGAYRMGLADEIVTRRGTKGLYTNTVFDYRREFLARIGPAVELGRSFVRMEYQRSYAPLLLLWKGIGEFIARHPRYRTLFGAVSISNEYREGSRRLMVDFLKRHHRQEELAGLVRARNPWRARPDGAERIGRDDIDELSAQVADIEIDAKGVPVLLRQYVKLGGKLVSFNVDAKFADSLDGLIVVDLTKTDARVLERYLGKEPARMFREYHERPAAG